MLSQLEPPLLPLPPTSSPPLAAVAAVLEGGGECDDGWYTEATAAGSRCWQPHTIGRHTTAGWMTVQDDGADAATAATMWREEQWERQWGASLSADSRWLKTSGWETQRRRGDERPSEHQQRLPTSPRHYLSPASPQLQPSDGQNVASSALESVVASLSLATHPAVFHSRLSAAHGHLFLPPTSLAASVAGSSCPLGQSPAVVRCCVLVLQSVPSSLFSLSSDTSEFVVSSSSADCVLLPSMRRVLTGFASAGSLLHSIERLVAALTTRPSDDAVSVAFGAALRSFCSHHKQQVESIVQQCEGSDSRPTHCTVIQLDVAARPLMEQLLWLHRLLQSSAPAAPFSSSASSLPAVPGGVALLSFLYRTAQSVSVASPFHTTLTFLFSAALTPYLRLLSSHVSCPSPPSVHAASSRPPLPLPSFLQPELERVNSAAAMLQATDRAGGGSWTSPDTAELSSSSTSILTVGWNVRDAERLQRALEHRGRSQHARLTAAVEQDETAWKESVERTAERRRRLYRTVKERALQQQAEERSAEESADSAKRRKQDEYREQLRQQAEEKWKRHDDEREQDRAESERAEERERSRRAILAEERDKLVTKIQAAQQGKTETEVRRDEWRKQRQQRTESIIALWQEDRRKQVEEMHQLRQLDPAQNHKDDRLDSQTDAQEGQRADTREVSGREDETATSDDAVAWGDALQGSSNTPVEAMQPHMASNTARRQARQRNLSSRVFDQQPPQSEKEVERGRAAKRYESAALVSNRRAMTTSRVFDSGAGKRSAEQHAGPPTHTPSPAATPLQNLCTQSELDAVTLKRDEPSPSAAAEGAVAAAVAATSTSELAELPDYVPPPRNLIAPANQSDEASMPSAPSQSLPVDVAVRSTLLPGLHQQCAFIERASLAFFLHSLRVCDHFVALQHFFLFRAGHTMEAFTAALFRSLRPTAARVDGSSSGQHSVGGVAPASALSTHSLQLLWSDALQDCPPSADPSRILVMVDTSGPPASAFTRIDSLSAADSVRLHYTAPPAVSYLLHAAPLAGYGRALTLLMRLACASSEMRRLYEWLRAQETQLRRRETEKGERVRASTSTSRSAGGTTTRRPLHAATATDDSLLLLWPTRQGRAQPPVRSPPSHGPITASALPLSPSRPSTASASQDDGERYLLERRHTAAARHFLHHTAVHQRWRLRWLHAARAEMQHCLVCLNQYVHTTVIHGHTDRFMQRLQAVDSVSALSRLHAGYIGGITAALHVNSRSPLASLVEALLATAVSFAVGVTSLPSFAAEDRADGDGGEDEERMESWQAVRDLHRQFRAHALLLSRMLHVAAADASGGSDSSDSTGPDLVSGVVQLQCAFDFNGYYAQRRQHELEERVLR